MSQVIELSIDDLGCLVIPTSLQTILGLSPGMMLFVEREHNGVRLRARPEWVEQAKLPTMVIVKKRGLKIARVQPMTDLTDITRFEREQRVTELLERVGL